MLNAIVFIGLLAMTMTVSSSSIGVVGKDAQIDDRSLAQLGAQILCSTGRNPTDYNGYGCYCGFGGHGQPVDEVDKCCEGHDKCYRAAANDDTKCGKFPPGVYLVSYKPKCVNAVAGCVADQPSVCAATVCSCDADLANCLKGMELNPEYSGYDNSKC